MLQGQRLVEPGGDPDSEALNVEQLAVAGEIGGIRPASMALVESRSAHRDSPLNDRICHARDEAVIRTKGESRQGVIPQNIAEFDAQAIRRRGFRPSRGPPIVAASQRVPDVGNTIDCQFHMVRIEDSDPASDHDWKSSAATDLVISRHRHSNSARGPVGSH